MFGDIESQLIRPKSNNCTRGVKSFRYNNSKGGGGLALARNDEYAKSFANGFTIIIDPADEEKNNDTSTSPTLSDSCGSDPDEKLDAAKETDETCETDNETASKSVPFQSECKTQNKETVTKKKMTNDEAVESKSDKNQKHIATSVANVGNGKRKPLSAGKNKVGIQHKNKLGLRLNIENEKSIKVSPYLKSSAGKSKSVTNRARQQYSLSRQKNNKVDAVSDVPKAKPECSKGNRKISRVENSPEEEPERKISSVCSTRSISVAEADDDQIVDNVTDTAEQNRITCYADVHREKTLSPRSTNEELSTLCSADMSSPARQRKISVISIGSVLKEGRETLV